MTHDSRGAHAPSTPHGEVASDHRRVLHAADVARYRSEAGGADRATIIDV